MKKHLFVTLALLTGASAGYNAYAEEAPLAQSPAAATINGSVVDENGEPVIGANVALKGAKGVAVNTNVNGQFTIKADPGATLVVSYIGYQNAEARAKNNMVINLEPTANNLEQLVVVGYGTQKKANLTGAVSTVDIEQTLGSKPQQDLTLALQGAVPGLTIYASSGDLNADATIRIRGVGTLNNGAKSNPLIVVDGVIVEDMNAINPNDVASISVLKDAASSSIYGTQAAFGVILITTKSGGNVDQCTVKYNANFGWDQATYVADYPTVPEQLRAALEGKANAGGGAVELFGMYFDKLLPYAEAWEKQNGGKRKGYSEMTQFKDWNNVGDYATIDGQNLYYANFDIPGIWYDNAAFSMHHDLSITGKSGKTKYYMSFGYDDKNGVTKIEPDNRKRYNANVNLSTQAFKWLEVGTRISFARRQYTRPETYNDTQQYLWRWGSFFIPSGTIVDRCESCGSPTGDVYDFRVIAMRKQANKRNFVTDNVRMTGYLKADIYQGLTLNADFTYAIRNYTMGWNDHSVYGMNWSGTTPGYIVSPGSCEIYREQTKSNTWTLNVYANYNKTFANDFNLGVMVGANAEKVEWQNIWAKRGQLLDENYPEINLADPTGMSNGGSHKRRASAGYFGRVNFDYKGIYLLELNGRYDGSSSFPRKDHWAFFPSGSIGYRFSEEGYFAPIKETNIFTNGKLRASYGEIGNQAVGDNMFTSLVSARTSGINWVLSDAANSNMITMYNMPTTVAESLKWERIRTTDIGLDLGFLNNQLAVTFDWYQRENASMIAVEKTLPSSFGTDAPMTNAGSLTTKGWELSINYNHRFGQVDTYAVFSIGDSKTTISKWNNDAKLLNERYTGKVYGDIWGFETERYFEESDFSGKNEDGSWTPKAGIASQAALENGGFHYGPGDIKFKDLNGDGKIDGGKGTADDHGDLKVIGNTLPRYEYSLRLGAAWNNFDIDLYLQGVGKRDVWTVSSFNFPLMRAADLAIYANQTSYNRVLWDDTYTNILGYEINQDNDYPRLYPGNDVQGTISVLDAGANNYYPQSKYLTNMAYLRCKNLTVGYTIPSQITHKAHIDRVRVYFTGANLFLLHKASGKLPVDPEVNASNSNLSYGTWGRTYPITRTYSVGLQVTF